MRLVDVAVIGILFLAGLRVPDRPCCGLSAYLWSSSNEADTAVGAALRRDTSEPDTEIESRNEQGATMA